MKSFIVLLSIVRLGFSTFDEEINYKYKTLSETEFIKYFNNLNLSWEITQYDNLNISKLACAFLKPREDLPYINHDLDSKISLPVNFDSRKQWPHCPTISEIYNQEHCGSCWTFGVATTASDRTCIHNNVTVRLSEQDFDCCKSSYDLNVCNGGIPDEAFECWVTSGLVSQECRPYDVKALKNDKPCEKTCRNGKTYQTDKHYGDKILRVPKNDNSIKAELFKNGPVETGFKVYEDFGYYKHGIYTHKFGALKDGHSVRIIGYGEENEVPYWLVANSWGQQWGLNGFFKIKRFQHELEFEDNIITGFPKRS